jgi:predicted ATPase/class 3 adenylate cyclase
VSGLPTGTVTFLFTDLQSSTRLWERDPEAMRDALAQHDTLLTRAVETHAGHVIKSTGDGLHAVFTTADAAVMAAVAGQQALLAASWGPLGALRVRMGLHTGAAEQRGDDYFGPVLNRAARLAEVSHPGQVVCSQATADLVRDSLAPSVGLVELGGHRLRDLDRPEIVFQVTHPELAADFPLLATSAAHIGNLPRPLTSFVGHDDDLTMIAAALVHTPLVTLTGVGGVGKTRLGLEAAARAAGAYRHGAWLCELADVHEADAVPGALLEAFGIEPRQGFSVDDTLLQFLRTKELLLVLDNCEHLLRPVTRLVPEIVRTSPGVRVLATSREGLGVPGERIVAVASLRVPDATEAIGKITESDAVRLFVERARGVRAEFAIDATNAGAVAEVCRRLDGIPLAIELAAARVVMLTPAELAQRLDQRFRLLTGSDRGTVERHQTLRAAIDWSYEMLHDDERRVLDRLSVFAGGFTLAAAEAVAADEKLDSADVFELLAGLVARSLVQADATGSETRYRLLETIRQYAQERLEHAGDTEAARDAHARYYATFTEDAAAGTNTSEQLEWLESADREVDNVRAALAWAIETEDAETVLRFFALLEGMWIGSAEVTLPLQAAASRAARIPGIDDDPRFLTVLASTALYCARRGDLEEMRRSGAALDAAELRLGVAASPYTQLARTQMASAEGRLDLWIEHGERAVALLRERADNAQLALHLSNLALGRYLAATDLDGAVAEAEEALWVAAQSHGPTILPFVSGQAAFVLADVHPDRASTLMHDALRDHARAPAGPLHAMLGDVAERLGDRRLALEYFALGMDEAEWLGWTEILGRTHRRIGLLIVDDDPEAAAVLLGAGLARSTASRLTGRVIDAQNRGIDELAATLGADRSRELHARGAAMNDHAVGALAHTAVAHALSGAGSREPEPAPAAASKGNVFRRHGDVWTLGYEGVSIQLRDAKGLRYLSRLLAEPGREVHTSDLASQQRGGGVPPGSGSGGEVLDDTARRAYQTRLAELDAERAEATEWNDPERLGRAEAEIDALTEQLAGAYGLGGRSRTMADPTERVRKAVTNRIRDSLDRIAQEHRALGRHLTNSVHTGTFCSYTPERPTSWEL